MKKYFWMVLVVLVAGCAEMESSSPIPAEKTTAEYAAEFYAAYSVVCIDSMIHYSGEENGSYPATLAFGPPRGAGENAGSLDVFNLGIGQNAIFRHSSVALVDGSGNDFKVFENSFRISTVDNYAWDFGWVEVSPGGADGSDPDTWDWYLLPVVHDLNTNTYNTKEGKSGLVGLEPIVVNYIDNPMDPRTSTAGGDGYDLADAKKILTRDSGNPLHFSLGNTLAQDNVMEIRYIRIFDGSSFLPDGAFGDNGLDVDAICFFNYR